MRLHWAVDARVLLVADLLHPLHRSAVAVLGDRDVRHGRVRRRAVPVLLARWDAHDVSGSNLLDWITPSLNAAGARPSRSGSALGDASATRCGHPARTSPSRHWRARFDGFEQHLDTNATGEVRRRRWLDGARAVARDDQRLRLRRLPP